MTKVHKYISEEQLKEYDYVIYTSASVLKYYSGVAYDVYENTAGKTNLIITQGEAEYNSFDTEISKYTAFFNSLADTHGYHIGKLKSMNLEYTPPRIAVVSTLELQMEQILGKKKIHVNGEVKQQAIDTINEKINNKDIVVDFIHVKSEKRKQIAPNLEKVANRATKRRDLLAKTEL